ncbi:MAG: enoyl-CoA hydratase/isomerase family protein [Verrucomicrobia bacterium]|nr:enoyl-CoA hydratase/isomerase family protein [Verrucomicrobiota bacterium]
MSELVLYQVKDHVATITLNRPEARNALSHALLDVLNDALRGVASDADARVVVLTGAGEIFCAGGDLGEMGAAGSTLELHQRRGAFVEFFRLMARLGKPTLAAVNGHALGGGLGLVLACDLAIAADHATFGAPEIKVGIWPMMVMASLIRAIGRKKAMELMLLGERIPASEAERIGLINRVVPATQFADAVAAWAAKLAAGSPTAFKLGRDALAAMSDMPFDDALEYLNGMLTLNLSTEDAREGIRAFLEKRKPEWKGR